MMRFLLAVVLSVWVASSAAAEEVETRHRSLTLLGNLELAEGKGIEDGVALLVHGTLAHRPLDSLDEIDAWIGWLKNNGATDIVLIGHSQGGNHVAVYGAERTDASVSALVLLAPATFDFAKVAEAYKARYGADLEDLVSVAETLVRGGQAVERISPVGFLSCANATATAGAIVAWYAPSPLRDTPTVLPRGRVRTLVIVAGNDELIPDLAPAARKLERPAGPGTGEIKVQTVDGADHFFRDLFIEDAADMIAAWLRG
jgi:pimeloyl-ACP methyl ester carboxylesterase